jgi:prepilin-type N-terminal cleavage/methylation domain-containing protein
MKGRAAFSLIEVLLACAILAVVLVPAAGTIRAQLAAVDRLAARLRLERLLEERLTLAEERLSARGEDLPSPAFRPGAIVFHELPPEETRHGRFSLWRIGISAFDPQAGFSRTAVRHVLLPAAPRGKETP